MVNVFDKYIRCSASSSSISNYNNNSSGSSGSSGGSSNSNDIIISSSNSSIGSGSSSTFLTGLLVGLRLVVLGFGDGRDTTTLVGFEVVGRVVVVVVVVVVIVVVVTVGTGEVASDGNGDGDGHTSVTGSADNPIDLGTSGSPDMHDNDVQP